ncbi:MAG: sulfotransferase [Proteobacteria bacterium]|nr:MAG: sulfotransferase [Pseudomonadota bacterium]
MAAAEKESMRDTAGRSIRIDDLAAPRLPRALRAANALLAPVARRLFPLDPGSLTAAARRRERAGDFGDASFEEPLRVLCDALAREADLSPVGRLLARELLLGLLATRLRLAALLREHPEIERERVEAPLVVLGLPRTGTTHLHELLAQHPSLRSLPYWESLEPIPARAVRLGAQPDRRRRRCEQALRLQHWVMPLFPALHEMRADAPHEEIQLLAADFRTMLFDASAHVPSYGAWYRSQDQTSAYRFLQRVLQALQWLRGPKRWVLKSPQHLGQLGPLLAVFPDARIVHTHRDPARVVASMCTMLAYGLRMQSRRVDPLAVGRLWGERIAAMLDASLRDRALVPAAQVLDLRFGDFMADEIGAALRVCEFAGLPAHDGVRRRFERYQAAHPRGRHGRVDYRLADFGLDAGAIRARLRAYAMQFGVDSED